MRRSLILLLWAALAPAQPAPAKSSGGSATQLLAAAEDLTRQVVALRGLKLLRPFERGVLSRDAIGGKLRERIAKEYTAEEIRTEAGVLKRLGLLPAEADYEQLLVKLLMEQVAGFYDPFARQLYIADWLGTDLQRPAMAHEIEHALQDQHFDLRKFATPIKDDGDKQLAHSALVEGDGTAVMLDFVLQSMGVDVATAGPEVQQMISSLSSQLASSASLTAPEFAHAPRFLRETLLFPYVAGMRFVMALRQPKPGAVAWSAIDTAFRSPPESTEQVLHPTKYVAHEHPVLVTPSPIVALSEWKELRRDVLGELAWRILLEVKLPDAEAEEAAAGWGGDRLVAYGSGDQPLALIDLSTWDTEADAIQIERALQKWMEGRSAGEAWTVDRHGREVLALFGVPSGMGAAISHEVWQTWRITRSRLR